MNHDKRIATSELKSGALVILKSGLRVRLADNECGDTRQAHLEWDEDYKLMVNASDIAFARFGAELVQVKHTSGEK